MVIRNCYKLLNELSELEGKISKIEKVLKENCPEVDIEKVLKQSLENHIKKSNS